jgi:hypothetical protein
MKLPLKTTEYIGADPEKAPHIDVSLRRAEAMVYPVTTG